MVLNLASAEFQQNPYALYTRFATKRQVAEVPATSMFFSGGWLVTRYADVMMVLKRPALHRRAAQSDRRQRLVKTLVDALTFFPRLSQ